VVLLLFDFELKVPKELLINVFLFCTTKGELVGKQVDKPSFHATAAE
jgi:hypothetical protein